jgi:Rrf2 family protein
MLSNTSKYAIRAMIYMALYGEHDKKIGIKKISGDLGIPSPFLAKILQVLAKHKLLSSTKGPNGGFGLSKNPEKITLYDIVTVIDGNDVFDKCLISDRPCYDENIPCPIHSKYESLRIELKNLFQVQDVGNISRDIRSQDRIFSL